MKRDEIERRIRAVAAALSEIPAKGGDYAKTLYIHGNESLVDLIATLGKVRDGYTDCGPFRCATTDILGVKIHAFGSCRDVAPDDVAQAAILDPDATETEPPPDTIGGAILSDDSRCGVGGCRGTMGTPEAVPESAMRRVCRTCGTERVED